MYYNVPLTVVLILEGEGLAQAWYCTFMGNSHSTKRLLQPGIRGAAGPPRSGQLGRAGPSSFHIACSSQTSQRRVLAATSIHT